MSGVDLAVLGQIDLAVLARIDRLQLRYVSALDGKDMTAWLATFAELPDTSYVCTTAESVAAGLPVALMLDDCRGRLEDRVTFVTKIWVGTYQEYQTRHIVQRVECKPAGPGRYDVQSNFVVAYTPSDTGRAEILTTGVYLDQVLVNGEGAQFAAKKAITDTPVLPRYIVFPL